MYSKYLLIFTNYIYTKDDNGILIIKNIGNWENRFWVVALPPKHFGMPVFLSITMSPKTFGLIFIEKRAFQSA